LASNYGPYKEIEDGKTGLLYDTPEEFVQKLSVLIENAELRKTLADGAKEWVRANRFAEVTAVGHAEFLRELRSIKKAELLGV
jgi:glycosyltransferase involved in cell wall biosynthesis